MSTINRRPFLAVGGTAATGTLFPALLFCLVVFTSPGAQAESPLVTSLSDPSAKFAVPEKPYVVLRRGAIEAVVVNNDAVNDDVLPGHRAGYNGLAALRHAQQLRSLFVPAVAGLNFEHIHDGTAQPREILFEPRNAPMELRVIDDFTAETF